MIRLVLEREGRAPEVWVCSEKSFIIGRGVDPPHWRLPYPDVSRRHLRFSVHGEDVFVEGLSERSPAYVNNRRLQGLTQLSDGDTVRFGNCHVRLTGAPQARQTSPSPMAKPARQGPSLRPALASPPPPIAPPSRPAPAPSPQSTPQGSSASGGDQIDIAQLGDMSDIVRCAKDWHDLDKPVSELLHRHMLRRGITWKKRGTPDLGQDGALVRLFVDTSREHRRLEWTRRGLAAATVVFAGVAGFTVATVLCPDVELGQTPPLESSKSCTPEQYMSALELLEKAKEEPEQDGLYLAGVALGWAEDSQCDEGFTVEASVREMLSGHRGHMLGKHSAAIVSTAIAPNGRFVASIDKEGQLELWDRSGRKMLAPSDRSYRSAIAWSADSDMLATGDKTGKITLWEVADTYDRDRPLELNALKTLSGHPRMISTLTFSPSENYLASVDISGKVLLWDVAGETIGEERGSATMFVSEPPRMVFDGSAKRLFGYSAGEVRTWQIDRGAKNRLGKSAKLPTDHEITAIAVHRDGDLVLTGDEQGSVLLWSFKGLTAKHRKLNRGSAKKITQVAFIPTTTQALFTTGEVLTRVDYRKRSRKAGIPPVYQLSAEVGAVDALLVDPSGQRALTVSSTAGRLLWDLEGKKQGRPLRKIDEDGPAWRAIEVVPNAAAIVVGDADGRVTSWDLLTERDNAGAWVLAEHRGEVDAIERAPAEEGSSTFFTASRDNVIRQWEYRSENPLTVTTRATEGAVKHLAVSGTYIAGAAQERLWIWSRRESEKPSFELNARRPIRHLGFSRDKGSWLVSIDETGLMRSWNVSQGLKHKPDQQEQLGGNVSKLLVLKEQAIVATTSTAGHGEVFSWDLNTSELVKQPISSGARYSALVASADGEHIAYGQVNGGVYLRRQSTPEAQASVANVAGEVTAMDLSGDSTRLVFGSDNGDVGLLTASPGEPPLNIDKLDDAISDVAFAGNNSILVAAGEHLYKYRLPVKTNVTRPGEFPVIDLYGHSEDITDLRVDPTGNYAVTTGLGGELMIWPLRGEELRDLLCSKLETKELSPGARQRHFAGSTERAALCGQKAH